MEKTKIEELLKGTVATVTEALSKLSDGDLAAVRAAEKAGQDRSTLLTVIDGELAERAEKANRAAGNGGTGERTFTQAELDAALADRDRAHAAEIQGMQQELGALRVDHDALLTADAVRVEGAAGIVSEAEPAHRQGFAGLVSLEGAFIRFIDDRGDIVTALAPMEFGPGDFTRKGQTITLTKEVELPPDLAASDILGAVLLDDKGDEANDAMATARLVQPFSIGGGRAARLPGGTLTFGPATSG